MTSPAKAMNAEVLIFETGSLPRYKFHEWNTASAQVAAYLRRLLEKYQTEAVTHIEIPSILDLAIFFNCCEMDVFDALYELKKQAYLYEIHGIDSPVRLKDPLHRKPQNKKKIQRLKWLKKLLPPGADAEECFCCGPYSKSPLFWVG